MNLKVKKQGIFCCLVLFASTLLVFAQEKPDALKMYNAGQYKSAISVCLSEISATPNNLDSYVVLVWSLLGDKQYSEALKWCQASKSISQYDSRILESEGEANYYLGKNDEAIRSFESYIIYAPNGSRLATVYYFLGELYLRRKAYAHADIAFSTAVQYNSGIANWWARLGYAREQNKENTYALQAYERALALDQNLQDAKLGRERIRSQL